MDDTKIGKNISSQCLRFIIQDDGKLVKGVTNGIKVGWIK